MPTVDERLERLHHELDALLRSLDEAEVQWQEFIDPVQPEYRCSAINLVHYWALRQVDIRDLQWRLTEFGLSSLGRSQAHVQATVQLVATAVAALRGPKWNPARYRPAVDIGEGERLLAGNATALLGVQQEDRAARIMVTLPAEAATDKALVSRLIQAGMRIARINCAHDDAPSWKAMAANVRAAAAALGRPCLVAMDLAGPKLRTGPLEPGPEVVRLRPTRNAQGQVITAGRGWLTSSRKPVPPPERDMVVIPVDKDWLKRRHAGDELMLRDTRGAKRRLLVTSVGRGGAVVGAEKTTYLGTGTRLKVAGAKDPVSVGTLPPADQAIHLQAGDILRVTRDCTPAPADDTHPHIGCTLPEVFACAKIGDPILFDDGRIGGRIQSSAENHFDVRIDHPSHGEVKLREAKGINLPHVDLHIPALTDTDIADLATVVAIADVVNLSFVREPADVLQLFDELDRLDAQELGVVLKIETPHAFDHLPQLILTAMRRSRVGVMIARGDLAVESGYERMAELQEETLWLCESAHLPVIWATQVLEQLAKTGQPSRAEITDAAMSERAECVMLNKGPYIVDAVVALDDILGRMAELEYKRSSLLRDQIAWQAPAE